MDINFIKKYESRAPRYTSYPPANFFSESVNNSNCKQLISESNSDIPQNISLYLHIPFCPRVCNFCGCTTFLNSDNDFLQTYIKSLKKEIKNVSSLINKSRLATQIHWGGGTPNALEFKYIAEIMDLLHSEFSFDKNAEIAMECNPAYMDFDDIDNYASLGFNRLSAGVQDFDPDVLKIINRLPSKRNVRDLILHMHSRGMKGINIDLVYGLPLQTPDSFANAALKAVESEADRIVTFSYAHVPWIKSAQKILEQKGLPDAEQKLEMFVAANDILTKSGYKFIGMDHYTKPDDALAVALNNGTLKRNFQGYCTSQTTGQVYGFGASAITQLHRCYIQNVKDPQLYCEMINKEGFAVERGYSLSLTQICVREAISEVMCNGILNFSLCANKIGVDVDFVKNAVEYDRTKFSQFVNDGILNLNDDGFILKHEAFAAVRNVAVLLDPMIKNSDKLFSKTI